MSEGMPARAVCFAGSGNPRAFEATVAGLGVEVVATRWWPDHHPYTPEDMAELAAVSDRHNRAVLVTTCKDLARLTSLPRPSGGSGGIRALKVGIDVLGEGGRILDDLIESVLASSLSD